MSIKVQSMVWDRYPASGNEMLLALCLADCAHDDGSSIWPSNETQARKTRTSEATVKRIRATMIARGWLELVRRASGRKGDTNEYRISAAWIAGGALQEPGLKMSPHDSGQKPVDNSAPADNTTAQIERDQGSNPTRPGLTAVTPESSGTIKEPYPLTPVAPPCGQLGSQKSDSQTAVTRKAGKGNPRWRWTGKRSDVEAEAKRHGIGPWDEQAFHRGRGESFAVYRARVEAAVAGEGRAGKDEAA